MLFRLALFPLVLSVAFLFQQKALAVIPGRHSEQVKKLLLPIPLKSWVKFPVKPVPANYFNTCAKKPREDIEVKSWWKVFQATTELCIWRQDMSSWWSRSLQHSYLIIWGQFDVLNNRHHFGWPQQSLTTSQYGWDQNQECNPRWWCTEAHLNLMLSVNLHAVLCQDKRMT